MTDCLKQYIDELNKQYRTGIAREHSYRPALKALPPKEELQRVFVESSKKDE